MSAVQEPNKEDLGLPSVRTMERKIKDHRWGTGTCDELRSWIELCVKQKISDAQEKGSYPPTKLGG